MLKYFRFQNLIYYFPNRAIHLCSRSLYLKNNALLSRDHAMQFNIFLFTRLEK